SRKDTDRCGRLWRRRALALALRPARGQSDIAVPFPDVAACAPFRARKREAAALALQQHERRRWLLLQTGADPLIAARAAESPAVVLAALLAEARLPPEPARCKDNESFRCRCAPSCLQTE